MSNIINFPSPMGRDGAFWPQANDLTEAVGIAMVKTAVWLNCIFAIESGEGALLAGGGKWPEVPTVSFLGSELPLQTLVEMARSLRGEAPGWLQALAILMDSTFGEDPCIVADYSAIGPIVSSLDDWLEVGLMTQREDSAAG